MLVPSNATLSETRTRIIRMCITRCMDSRCTQTDVPWLIQLLDVESSAIFLGAAEIEQNDTISILSVINPSRSFNPHLWYNKTDQIKSWVMTRIGFSLCSTQRCIVDAIMLFAFRPIASIEAIRNQLVDSFRSTLQFLMEHGLQPNPDCILRIIFYEKSNAAVLEVVPIICKLYCNNITLHRNSNILAISALLQSFRLWMTENKKLETFIALPGNAETTAAPTVREFFQQLISYLADLDPDAATSKMFLVNNLLCL